MAMAQDAIMCVPGCVHSQHAVVCSAWRGLWGWLAQIGQDLHISISYDCQTISKSCSAQPVIPQLGHARTPACKEIAPEQR